MFGMDGLLGKPTKKNKLDWTVWLTYIISFNYNLIL